MSVEGGGAAAFDPRSFHRRRRAKTRSSLSSEEKRRISCSIGEASVSVMVTKMAVCLHSSSSVENVGDGSAQSSHLVVSQLGPFHQSGSSMTVVGDTPLEVMSAGFSVERT